MTFILAVVMGSWFLWSWALPQPLWGPSAILVGLWGVGFAIYDVWRGNLAGSVWGFFGFFYVVVGVGMSGPAAQTAFEATIGQADHPYFLPLVFCAIYVYFLAKVFGRVFGR